MTGSRRPAGEWVQLDAMLQHPLWRGVTVLAGPSDIRRRITGGVVVTDLAAEPHELRGSLLIVAFSGDRSDWRLDAALTRARDAGASGMLISSHQPVRRSTALLSTRLGLPLLGAEDPLAAYVALSTLIGQAAALRAELIVRTAAACQRAGPAVEDVLTELERTVQRPVALLDQGSNRVAGPQVLWGDDWDEVHARLHRRGSNAPLGVPIDLPSGAMLIAQPLTGAAQKSWLAVKLPADLRAEVDALLAALAVGAVAVQERLALRRLGVERDARYRAALLEEMVRTTGELALGVRRRALDLGWRLDGWQAAVYLGALADVDTTDLRAEVTAALGAEGVDAVVVEQESGWAAWTTWDSEPSADQVKELGLAIRRAQHRLTSAVETFVGVGRVHPGPSGIARSLAEALDAARLARGHPESGRFLHIDRLGLAQLLLAWTRTDTFQPAARALLAPLRNDTGDLLPTLSAYLDAESSFAETAAILGIHRNTVAARVARIQDILGVDLADPETRLALHLACRTTNQSELAT